MSTTLWRSEIGTEGYAPGTVLLNTTDNLSTITTAGYLNNAAAASSVQIRATDFIFANYSGGNGLFTVTINGSGVITMVNESIQTPVTVANGGTGDTSLTAYAVLCGGTTSTGNVQSIASVGTIGQVLTSNDAGALPTMQALPAALLRNNTNGQMASGNTLLLDKGTGTEASNAVTISHQSGVITTSSLTTAAGSTYAITLTNTKIATSSVVLVSLMGGSNTTLGVQLSATAASGSSVITIANINAASALNGTLLIGFTVL